jgi:hypothetical protein
VWRNECWCARSIKPSEGRRSRLRRTRWVYGNCMRAEEGPGRDREREADAGAGQVEESGRWQAPVPQICLIAKAVAKFSVDLTRFVPVESAEGQAVVKLRAAVRDIDRCHRNRVSLGEGLAQ